MAAIGDVHIGEWAHVKYMNRQHHVVAVEPLVDSAEPVRFTCGGRAPADFIWHEAPEPHLPRCARCLKGA